MPTVRDVELAMLRQYEAACKNDDEDRINEVCAALRVLRELFAEHLKI